MKLNFVSVSCHLTDHWTGNILVRCTLILLVIHIIYGLSSSVIRVGKVNCST